MASSIFVGLLGPTAQVDNLLIVTPDTTIPLEIHSNFANGLDIYTHSDTAFRAPAFNLNRSKGTQAAPTLIANGNHLGYINLNGYDGSAYAVGAEIISRATEDWSASAHGCNLHFLTTAATTTTLTQRMIILDSGRVGLNINAPTALLHLNPVGTAANGAALKIASAALLTSPEVGAVEFLTDNWHGTITTGTARKGFVLDDGSRLTSGKIPIASTNGRLIDGQTPLAGTKTYWVSDSSGGAVNRKLTFTAGILTAET